MKQKELLDHFNSEMSKLFALVAFDFANEDPGMWQQSKETINNESLETLISWNLIYRDYQETNDKVESLGLTARGLRLAEWAKNHNDGWLKGTTLLTIAEDQ